MKLRENSPVEFDLDGRVVTGTVVRLERGGKVVVRYGSEQILNLQWYNVMMVKTEVGDDSEEEEGYGISISGRNKDDFDLEWYRCEDDESTSYF